MIDSIKEAVEKAWISRAKTQQLKFGSKKYREAETEFFVGAMAGINSVAKNYKETGLDSDSFKNKDAYGIIPSWFFGAIRGSIMTKEDFYKTT